MQIRGPLQADPAQSWNQQDQGADLQAARKNAMKRKLGQPIRDPDRLERLPGPKNRRRHKTASQKDNGQVGENFAKGRKFAAMGH